LLRVHTIRHTDKLRLLRILQANTIAVLPSSGFPGKQLFRQQFPPLSPSG